MSTHTPKPWRVSYGNDIVGADRDTVICGFDHGNDFSEAAFDEAEANAAFAVLAVNNHANLVAALQGLLRTAGGPRPAWMSAQELAEAVLRDVGVQS